MFIRELISNASDALEKLRYLRVIENLTSGDKDNLEIHISTDKQNRLLIIQDTGIGMTKDELISHLGTIARSGSKVNFLILKSLPSITFLTFSVIPFSHLWSKSKTSNTLTMRPKSLANSELDFTALLWSLIRSKFTPNPTRKIQKASNGFPMGKKMFAFFSFDSGTLSNSMLDTTRSGSYEISTAEGVQPGTKIVMHLKPDCREFSDDHSVNGNYS